MAKTLVLAEKPSVAKDLAHIIGATDKHKTYYEGKDYVVTWAYGHLLTLKMPEDLNPEWRQWALEPLPMLPKHIGTKPLPKTRGQLKAIGQLAKRSDIKAGIIATDSGRAGELLARWILQWVKFNKPLKRLWISSQTVKSVKDGFKHLAPAQKYDQLYESELARTKADWLVGLNVTRALTTKYKDNLNAGRVQTPTLNLINQAQQKRESFIPQTYYTVSLQIQNETGVMLTKHPMAFKTHDQAEACIDQLATQPGRVTSVTVKENSQSAPLPFDLTDIQLMASNKYHFSAKKTLSLIQSLYEIHKIVSYPRTDSKYLPQDILTTLPERLKAIAAFEPDAKKYLQQGAKVTKPAVFNDAKVTDHYALIPTEERPRLDKLSNDELKIYQLIVERFLGLFAAKYITATTTAIVTFGDQQFKFKHQIVKQAGWQRQTVDQTEAVAWQNGQQITKPKFQIKKALTAPPKLLSDGTLLAQMEKYNLGTPATRAEIIEKLLHSELAARQNNDLVVTPKGKQLLKLVNPSLVSPELTASWEKQLEAIAKGRQKSNAFIKAIEQDTKRLVQEIKQSDAQYKDYAITTKICPKCGSPLRERNTKTGKFYVCTNTECDYRRRKDPKVSNHRCPQCHRKMEILEGKNGPYFRCKYDGTTEKMTSKKQRSQKMNKHETRKLMQKVNQADDPGESPLALALKAAMKEK
ncbi:DNA topoisomerase 3 [Agrilactobacillus fermenti]|uniref:DNA topoisomerase 3 n=1 Tax=Agrilactobacillus fermenti TaxID=2586909 RepID=UPI003A5BE260